MARYSLPLGHFFILRNGAVICWEKGLGAVFREGRCFKVTNCDLRDGNGTLSESVLSVGREGDTSRLGGWGGREDFDRRARGMHAVFMRTVIKAVVAILLTLSLPSVSVAGEGDGKVWLAEVSGMSCPLCANNIEKQLKRDRDVGSVVVDLGAGTVKVVYLQGKPSAEWLIRKAIERAGFTVGNVSRVGD